MAVLAYWALPEPKSEAMSAGDSSPA